MRVGYSFGLAILTLCFAAALPLCVADATSDEMTKLQGTWTITSMARQGQPDAKFDYTKIVIQGDKLQVYSGWDPGPERGYIIQSADPSKSPAWLDLVTDDKGKSAYPAVYKLDGDELKLCMYKKGGQRPSEIGAKESDVITMKRQK